MCGISSASFLVSLKPLSFILSIDVLSTKYRQQQLYGHSSPITKTIQVRRPLAEGLECSPMARETWVQSQVGSYQRLKKWYLMPPCLTLSIIRYVSRVKWSNPGKEVAPSPTPWCSSYRKGSLRVTLDNGRYVIGVVCVCDCMCGISSASFLVSLKPLSFILSIDVLSTKYRQMIKRYGANTSSCSTPATMSKKSVSPSGAPRVV